MAACPSVSTPTVAAFSWLFSAVGEGWAGASCPKPPPREHSELQDGTDAHVWGLKMRMMPCWTTFPGAVEMGLVLQPYFIKDSVSRLMSSVGMQPRGRTVQCPEISSVLSARAFFDKILKW